MSNSNGDEDPLVGRTLADRYRIDALLGEGGMGKVYAAEHVLMKKKLALKVLHRELSNVPDVVARFEREARAAANIEHANVAAATDFGKLPDGDVYLALEYVEGRSLRDVIAAEAPMLAARALRIARQIASALASAHALSIVHRDLKPENVMLVRKGVDPDFVKVLDFGIAKVPIGIASEDRDQPITKMSMILGTPEYMAPEQAMSDKVDGRSDVFALGVILYEMLCGMRPFTKRPDEGILAQQLRAGAPSLAVRAPHLRVPPQVDNVVMQLLSIKRDARPPAREVVSMIDALLVQQLGETGQMFTQISGTMVQGGSWPDTGSSPGLGTMPSSPELRPGSVPDAWPGSVPDVARDAFGSVPGALPANGSLPDAGLSPAWPSTDSSGAAGSGPDAAIAGAGEPAPLGGSDAASTAASSRMPSDPREAQISVADSAAPALIPGLGRPWPAPLLRVFAWIDARRPGLPEPLRRIPAPAFVGAAAALAALGGLTLLVMALGAVASAGPVEAAVSAIASAARVDTTPVVTPASGPTPEELSAAQQSGDAVTALAALAEKYPQSAEVQLELAKASRLKKDYAKTVDALARALTLNPQLDTDKEVATLLWTAAQHGDSRETAFGLLEGPMGKRGADIVYDLAIGRRVGSVVKKRAGDFLASDRFQSQASPALRVAAALRSAKTCDAIHALLPRAKQEGDERALRYLRRYESRRGCGRRRSRDCYPCLRTDTNLRDAIAAIEKRTKG